MNNLISTETLNKNTENIDITDTLGIVTLINNEDLTVAQAVQKALPQIAQAVDIISSNFQSQGRLLYFGAGTSGRLGILDASECPPTFNTDPSMVQGIIAGGDTAIKTAVEGAEDSAELAKKDFREKNINKNDTIVCISASGNANYVVKILELAKNNGCKTIALSCNKNAKMKDFSDCFIFVDTGAEAISGSTRMKAGTAQKMVLNMLTTASMIKIGKTYKNYMIDVKPTNDKLKKRAERIVASIANCSEETALKVLTENNYDVKCSILRVKYNIDAAAADNLLKQHGGVLRKVFEAMDKEITGF